MSHIKKEYPITNKQGNVVLTVKLIGRRSRIFIDGEEIMTCRSVPLPIPTEELEALENIESINDVIDHFKYNNPAYEHLDVGAELDFFVNCSNLQVWVENDYDTRLLDYMLSFPLLERLAEKGFPRATFRFKEELLKRYQAGKWWIQEYLFNKFAQYFYQEDLYSQLPEKDQAMATLKLLAEKCIVRYEENDEKTMGQMIRISLYMKEDRSENEFERMVKALSIFKDLKEISIVDESCKGVITHLEGPFPQIGFLELHCVAYPHLFDNPDTFPSLKSLYIGNYIHPKLPQGLGNLKSLKELEINSYTDNPSLIVNMLPESIGKLTNLQKLTIEECNLTTLPESFGNLANLTTLTINHCGLKSLPQSFGKLENLETIDLKHNCLRELPSSFSNLGKLSTLDLSHNRFEAFPLELVPLPSLRNLYLNKNLLKELPPEVGGFKTLEGLELNENSLSELPEQLGENRSIGFLSLRKNKLHSLPENMSKMKELWELDIGYNHFTEFPKNATEIQGLEEINLEKNPISSIPGSISKLKLLYSLDFSGTNLDSLPDCLGTFRRGCQILVKDTRISKDKVAKFKRKFKHIKIETF